MPKSPVPFHAVDVTDLARSLARQLAGVGSTPGHLELLNMLARAIGCRNYQDLRARAPARPAPAGVDEVVPVDLRLAERVSQQFDAFGQLVRLPARPSHQLLALWVFWSDFPPDRDFDEAEVNRRLRARHLFDDPATLRRMMVSAGLLARTSDGRVYRRVEREPPADALHLIRLAAREPSPGLVLQVESYRRRLHRLKQASA